MSLIFDEESVASCWNEVMELAQGHWAGTKTYRRHQPFVPSFERYEQANRTGFFRLFTARDQGKLVGYFGMYLTLSMHSQLPLAVEDTFYLHPDARKGRNAIRFIRFIEDTLRRVGIVELMFSCEVENPVARKLLEYLDYRPVIVQCSKYLSSPPGADSTVTAVTECVDVCT